MTEVVWAARADAEAVADRIASVVADGGRKSIAAPGGRTPVPILEQLARRWSAGWDVDVWLTDERITPETHPASNYGALARALQGTGARVHRLTEGPVSNRFNLVWVGMGADGHVASLFPGAQAPTSAPAVVKMRPDPLPPEAPFERLTLTFSALTATDELIIVARGAEKRALLEAAVDGRSQLPIGQLIAAARCPVTIYWSL